MRDRLEALRDEALAKIEAAQDLKALQDVRVSYLGKKGPITEVLRGMGKLSAEERPLIGQMANDVRDAIKEQLEIKEEGLEQAAIEAKLANESIDVTLPGRPAHLGFKSSVNSCH